MGTRNHLHLFMFLSTLLITLISISLVIIIGKNQSDKLLQKITVEHYKELSRHQVDMLEYAIKKQLQQMLFMADTVIPKYADNINDNTPPSKALEKPLTEILKLSPTIYSCWFVYGHPKPRKVIHTESWTNAEKVINEINVTVASNHLDKKTLKPVPKLSDQKLSLNDKIFSYDGYLYDKRLTEASSKQNYISGVKINRFSDWQHMPMLRILVRVEHKGNYLGILGADYNWDFFSRVTDLHGNHPTTARIITEILSTSLVEQEKKDKPEDEESQKELQKQLQWLEYLNTQKNVSTDQVVQYTPEKPIAATVFTPITPSDKKTPKGSVFLVTQIPHDLLHAEIHEMDKAVRWGLIFCFIFAIVSITGIAFFLRKYNGKFDRWFNQVLETMTVPMLITDLEGNLEFISPKAIEIFSKVEKPTQILKKNIHDVLNIQFDPEHGSAFKDLPEDKRKIAYCSAAGVNYAVRSRYIRDSNGEKFEICTVFSDITEWKSMEQIMEASACGIALVDAETFEVKSINRAGLEINGFRRKSDVIGHDCKATICLARGEKPCYKCGKGEAREVTESFVGPDGKLRHALSVTTQATINGRDYYVETFVDITHQKEVELQLSQRNSELERLNMELNLQDQQMMHQEKMASIGQLAAGVAHEINNPIGYVSSNLRTLKEYITIFHNLFTISEELIGNHDDAQAVEDTLAKMADLAIEEDISFVLEDSTTLVDESIYGMMRVRDIVKNLKSFARPDETAHKETDINAQIEATLKMVYNELKYKCNIIKKYGEIPRVSCSPGELSQVFMNLLVNASHAIKEKGDIGIRTWAEDKDHVKIAISDTGSGISPENLSRIFDPFFTTKEVGKGTGLGLAISHGIIQKHNGEINVKSKVGKGTIFTITLPVSGVEEQSKEGQKGQQKTQ